MPESITPKPEEKKTIKNEYDFRRELLSALEEDSSSNNEVKDTEIYRQHILHALGQEFDQDDIKQTNNFRAKVVDGVKELVNGGGGGGDDLGIIKANVKFHGTIPENDTVNIDVHEIGTTGMWTGMVFGAHYEDGRATGWRSNNANLIFDHESGEQELDFLILSTDNFSISIPSDRFKSVSGSAEYNDSTGVLRVTGDCEVYFE